MIFINKNNLFFSLIICATIALFSSCSEEPYRLDARDRAFIDSTSSKMILQLAKTLDDSCKKHFEQNVKHLTDSLVEYQIKDIDKKLHQK